MRLPWVARSTVDDITAIYKGWLDSARDENIRVNRAYMDLLGKYHQLRLSGATPEDPSALVSRETPEPDPVLLAVTARAGGDGRKRAMMLNQVRLDRANHKSDIEILQAIEAGVTSEGMPS